MIRATYIFLFTFLLQPAFSQLGFQAVLDSVAANNKTLAAGYQYSQAQKIGAKTGIYLGNPSVTFDRLSSTWGTFSEMIVSQSFDFPTVYMHKSKIANLSASQFEERYRQTKLEIFTNTALVYSELINVNWKISMLAKRQQKALQLQSGIEKRLNAGDANIFEVNRIRSELAKAQSELQLAESSQKVLLLKLTELNGGKYITVNDTVFPVFIEINVSDTSINAFSARNPQIKQWEAEALIAERNVNLQRALSLPKFEIGYRQDINTAQTFTGFHAGITIPLFENKNAVRSAKANQLYAIEAVDAYRLEIQSNVSQIITEYKAVQQSLTSMTDVFNTLNTPDLLMKAFNTGQINYSEFFTEYENYQQTALYIEVLNQKASSLQLQLYVLANM